MFSFLSALFIVPSKAEINNGRLAMIGLMAFLSEGAIPGSVPALKGLILRCSGEVIRHMGMVS